MHFTNVKPMRAHEPRFGDRGTAATPIDRGGLHACKAPIWTPSSLLRPGRLQKEEQAIGMVLAAETDLVMTLGFAPDRPSLLHFACRTLKLPD